MPSSSNHSAHEHRGRALALDPDASLDGAFAAILRECRTHFKRHAAALRLRCDAEDVHQLRVALRRLRAFLGLVKAIAPGEQRAALAAQAKDLAGAMGPARDMDVFCEGLQRDARELLEEEPKLCALLDAAERRRFAAQEKARAAIAADAAKRFEAALDAFIAQKPWRGGPEPTEESGSARAFATRALRRSRKRALRRCEDLAQASPERLHSARIAVKKARYAADLFAGLFGAKEAKGYIRGLAKIQDRFGEANDRATAERLLAELVDADAALAPARDALLRRRGERSTLDEAAKAGRWAHKLRRVKPFWRPQVLET